MVFSSIFLLHLLGMIYTTNLSQGLNDLRVKLPLLILPFIIAGMPALPEKKINAVLWLFVSAVFGGTLVSASLKLGWLESDKPVYRPSIFISHIRFSLILCLSIFMVARFMLKSPLKIWFHATCSGLILWLFAALLIVKSMTGIVSFIAGVPVLLFFAAKKFTNKKYWRL